MIHKGFSLPGPGAGEATGCNASHCNLICVGGVLHALRELVGFELKPQWLFLSVLLFCSSTFTMEAAGEVLTVLFAVLLLDLAGELLWRILWRGGLPLFIVQFRKCGKVTKDWANFFVKS